MIVDTRPPFLAPRLEDVVNHKIAPWSQDRTTHTSLTMSSTNANGEINGVPPPHTIFDTILVLDFGSQYTHLITLSLIHI